MVCKLEYGEEWAREEKFWKKKFCPFQLKPFHESVENAAKDSRKNTERGILYVRYCAGLGKMKS